MIGRRADSIAARIVLGPCLCLLVAGCAVPELAWNLADNVIVQRTDDWLDLESRQQAQLQSRLQPWLQEVRRDRLGEVADAIDEFATRITPKLDLADARWAENRFRQLYNETMTSFLPVIAPTLAAMDERQHKYLAERLDEENREDRERFTSGRDDGRYTLAERMIEQVERWTGVLDTEQRALVHARVREFPDSGESWLAYRERMQQKLLGRIETGASAAELERTLHDWWIKRTGRTPEQAEQADAFRREVRETLVAVARSLSPMQQAETRRRLRDRSAILRQLADTAPR